MYLLLFLVGFAMCSIHTYCECGDDLDRAIKSDHSFARVCKALIHPAMVTLCLFALGGVMASSGTCSVCGT